LIILKESVDLHSRIFSSFRKIVVSC